MKVFYSKTIYKNKDNEEHCIKIDGHTYHYTVCDGIYIDFQEPGYTELKLYIWNNQGGIEIPRIKVEGLLLPLDVSNPEASIRKLMKLALLS